MGPEIKPLRFFAISPDPQQRAGIGQRVDVEGVERQRLATAMQRALDVAVIPMDARLIDPIPGGCAISSQGPNS